MKPLPWFVLVAVAAVMATILFLQDPEETTIENPNEHLTKDSASLYRHSKAHGGGGIYCCACHGFPPSIKLNGPFACSAKTLLFAHCRAKAVS